MGTFTQRLTLYPANGTSIGHVELDALVDTGAMVSAVPASTLRRLGVRPFRTIPVRFAAGDVREWEMGQVDAEVDGQRMPILVLFGAEDAPPQLGAHALEAFLVTVDPVDQKLVRREAFLM